MKLSNKEKVEKIDIYLEEIESIFDIEANNPNSPIYEFLNNRSYKNLVEGFYMDPYCNIVVVHYFHGRHSGIIRGESENVNRVLELADSIVDLLSIDKKDFKSVVISMTGICSDIIPCSNEVHDENMRLDTINIMNELFNFIYPREKEYLFSDWIESFLDLIKTIPMLNKIRFRASIKMFIEKLQLTDSDRESSKKVLQ